MDREDARRAIDAVWRIESARLIAGLALLDGLVSEPAAARLSSQFATVGCR
jgi:hypothetical protein